MNFLLTCFKDRQLISEVQKFKVYLSCRVSFDGLVGIFTVRINLIASLMCEISLGIIFIAINKINYGIENVKSSI